MAILNKNGKLIANVSEPFKIFKSEADYTAWVATLPAPTDISSFAIVKDWGNHATIHVQGSSYAFETANTLALDFLPTTDYEKDELIYHAEMLYRARAKFTSTDTFSAADWESLAASGVMDNFIPNNVYKALEFITHKGKIYRAKADFTATTDFDIANWEDVSKAFAPSYAQDTAYLIGETVIYESNMYRAIEDMTSPATGFEAAKWQKLSESGIPEYTQEEWTALPIKPALAIITDSVFDL